MPEESRTDAVEKFLTEQKSMEDRKQALIDDLLHQRDVAIKAFDEKLVEAGLSREFRQGSTKPPQEARRTRCGGRDEAGSQAKGLMRLWI